MNTKTKYQSFTA